MWKFVFTTWLIITIKVIATITIFWEICKSKNWERIVRYKQLFSPWQFLVYIFQLCFMFPPWNKKLLLYLTIPTSQTYEFISCNSELWYINRIIYPMAEIGKCALIWRNNIMQYFRSLIKKYMYDIGLWRRGNFPTG